MQKKIGVLLLCLLVGLCIFISPQAHAEETDITLRYDDRKDLSQLLDVTVDKVVALMDDPTSLHAVAKMETKLENPHALFLSHKTIETELKMRETIEAISKFVKE